MTKTPRRMPARKPGAGKARIAPPSEAATAAPRPDTLEGEAPELRKTDLIDRVVARSGVKKKDAKPVVEATLAALGEMLGQSGSANLQPLGKLRVAQRKELANGQSLTLKLRRKSRSSAAPQTLAVTDGEG